MPRTSEEALADTYPESSCQESLVWWKTTTGPAWGWLMISHVFCKAGKGTWGQCSRCFPVGTETHTCEIPQMVCLFPDLPAHLLPILIIIRDLVSFYRSEQPFPLTTPNTIMLPRDGEWDRMTLWPVDHMVRARDSPMPKDSNQRYDMESGNDSPQTPH